MLASVGLGRHRAASCGQSYRHAHVYSTTNARELFGLKEGETVLDAMARNTSAKAASNAAVTTQEEPLMAGSKPQQLLPAQGSQ